MSPSCNGLFDHHVTTTASPLIEGCGQMAYGYFTAVNHCHITHWQVRREIGSGDAGEGGKRGGSGMERESAEVGRWVFMPPSFLQQSPPSLWGGDFSFEQGCMNPTCCPHSFLFWMGAAWFLHAAPCLFPFRRGQHDAPYLFPFQTGGTVMPPIYFYLEQGQCDSCCPLFLFILNRGSMIPTCCPLFLFVLNGGSVIPTHCPLFLFVLNRGGVILHAAPVSFCFEWEQCDPTHCPRSCLSSPFDTNGSCSPPLWVQLHSISIEF